MVSRTQDSFINYLLGAALGLLTLLMMLVRLPFSVSDFGHYRRITRM